MAAANTTDGLLNKLDVTVLKDDKHVFPPYQACIVVRQEALARRIRIFARYSPSSRAKSPTPRCAP